MENIIILLVTKNICLLGEFFSFHSAKCHSFFSFTCKTLRWPLIEKCHISVNPHLVLYIALMIHVFCSNLSNNFVFLIYFFQSMIWPFLALQLLFVCVPSFRQVSYWYTIDVFINKPTINCFLLFYYRGYNVCTAISGSFRVTDLVTELTAVSQYRLKNVKKKWNLAVSEKPKRARVGKIGEYWNWLHNEQS